VCASFDGTAGPRLAREPCHPHLGKVGATGAAYTRAEPPDRRARALPLPLGARNSCPGARHGWGRCGSSLADSFSVQRDWTIGVSV